MALRHAIRAGGLLHEIKRIVGHGQWLQWLKTECPEIKERQAQRYTRLWENRSILPADATIEEALDFLAESRDPSPTTDLPPFELVVQQLHHKATPPTHGPSVLGTPLDDSNVRKEFMAIVRKAELRHRTPYAMRHTFVSTLLQKGVSLAYVSKQAGHKSMDITLNTYGHFVPGGNRQLVDLLDDEGTVGARRTA